MYSVIHKRVFTTFRDLLTQIIEAIDNSSNSTMEFWFTKKPRIVQQMKMPLLSWKNDRNTLPKALWFNEANYERSKITHCIMKNASYIMI